MSDIVRKRARVKSGTTSALSVPNVVVNLGHGTYDGTQLGNRVGSLESSADAADQRIGSLESSASAADQRIRKLEDAGLAMTVRAELQASELRGKRESAAAAFIVLTFLVALAGLAMALFNFFFKKG